MQNKRHRILLVEDNDVDLMAFRRFARSGQLSYDYDTARSVKEAIDILKSQEFDVVVSDYILGDGTAFDLFDRIKDTPGIIVTGAGDEEIAVQAMKLGAYDYLIKDPAGDHLKILSVTVQNAIDRKQAEDELKRYQEHLGELVKERTAELQAEVQERMRVEKELEETNAFLHNMLESSSSVSIISTDLEGKILYWNVGAESMFGYKAEEVVGSCSIDILYSNEAETKKEMAAARSIAVKEKKEVNCKVIEETKDGRKLWINLAVSPRLDESGRVIGVLGVGSDVTERMKVERMKDEVISNAGHELRSPLTSILNALGLLADGSTGRLSAQAQRMVDIAHKNSARLLRMIDNMLDIKKIELGKMIFNLEPLELMPLLEQAIEANRMYARLLGAEIVLENSFPDIKVNVDSDRLMQVLTNLLSNAAKFSPADDTVIISVSHYDGTVRIAVTDHGPGIPEEFRNRIFQKFEQAISPGTRKVGGTGLGLSIAKALVEGMDGQIAFETELDVGTTFYFELPEL